MWWQRLDLHQHPRRCDVPDSMSIAAIGQADERAYNHPRTGERGTIRVKVFMWFVLPPATRSILQSTGLPIGTFDLSHPSTAPYLSPYACRAPHAVRLQINGFDIVTRHHFADAIETKEPSLTRHATGCIHCGCSLWVPIAPVVAVLHAGFPWHRNHAQLLEHAEHIEILPMLDGLAIDVPNQW